ncbi:large ribosomal subunit protein uL22 [Candidatus Hydrogenosomobacter endosymbioticus]|uniref:50S ribosomal protein L22 n=1 Tax=Candidatus Hydrogenosomobacter endosymbioticus TaxID=2558174 RepID=A0ABM7V861_9PROT|nr:uL22 family ribosomal protein [Candidatus Hydrogenosomobacter endosymbioticus]BDB95945.1 50S ribosomal protein L22 [Candidatus Hydrogenosomobacter endosymbioticus]
MLGYSSSDFVEAKLRMLRISSQKLNLVAKELRGLAVVDALGVLSGMRKRVSLDVKKLLLSAVANAENNFGMDVDRLRVVEASVGRNALMKRLDIRGRSRAGRRRKEFSQMRIVLVQEKD